MSGNAALAILIANALIGMNDYAMMACRLYTLPALNIISIAAIILAEGNAAYLLRRNPTGKESSGNARAGAYSA
jgi:hypothetical protein